MSSRTHVFILGGTGRIGRSVITKALSQGHQVTALIRKPNGLEPRPNLTLVTGSPTSSSDILRALTVISESESTSTTSNPSTTRPHVTIIFTLGQTRINPSNPWSKPTSPAYFMSQSLEALIDTIRSTTMSSSSKSSSTPNPILNIQISKLIILSMFGTTNSFQHMSWPFRWTMNYSNMKQTLDDHNRVIEIVESTCSQRSNSTPTSSSPTTAPTPEQPPAKLPIPFTIIRPSMLVFNSEGPIAEVREWGNGSPEMGFMPKTDARAVVKFLVDRVRDGRFEGEMPVISN